MRGRDALPTVTVRWGDDWTDEHGRLQRGSWVVKSEALRGLCGFVAELEECAVDGGDAKSSGQFTGAPWTINGAQAFLAGACIAIKLMWESFRRHRGVRVTESDEGPGRP